MKDKYISFSKKRKEGVVEICLLDKNMEKGFSLIELLAVIVIIGIIALITYPVINDVVTGSERNTFKSSVNELVNIVEIDYNEYQRGSSVNYVFNGKSLTCDVCNGKTIKYSGEIENGTGSIVIKNGKATDVNVQNKYYKAFLNSKGKIEVTDKG